jgi:hypothetical protein
MIILWKNILISFYKVDLENQRPLPLKMALVQVLVLRSPHPHLATSALLW